MAKSGRTREQRMQRVGAILNFGEENVKPSQQVRDARLTEASDKYYERMSRGTFRASWDGQPIPKPIGKKS